MEKSNKHQNVDHNRRDFVKKAAYTAPVIVTMAALPSFASAGSGLTPTSTSIQGKKKHKNSGRTRTR